MAPVIPASCSFEIGCPLDSFGEEDWEISPEETAEEPGGVDDSFSPSIWETAWRREECLAGVKSRFAICDERRVFWSAWAEGTGPTELNEMAASRVWLLTMIAAEKQSVEGLSDGLGLMRCLRVVGECVEQSVWLLVWSDADRVSSGVGELASS